MVDLYILEEFIDESFDFYTKKAGKELFQNNAVQDLSITEYDIVAKVLDQRVYYVSFDLFEDEEFAYLDGNCTCGIVACKHQAAVLYAVLDKLKNPSKSSSEIIVPSKGELEGNHAGNYRHLPLDKGLSHAISHYQNEHYYYTQNWGENFIGSFISPKEIEFINYSNNPHIYHRNKKRVRLKEKDGKVYIKCFTCSDPTKTLCKHQWDMLSALSDTLGKLDLQNLKKTYLDIFEAVAKERNSNPKTIKKYFNINITSEGITLVAKHTNIVGEQWMKNTQQILDHSKELRKKNINKNTLSLEEGRAQRYAFIWKSHATAIGGSSLEIEFATGAGYKVKAGIKDLGKKIQNFPNGFPVQKQLLGQQLYFLVREENPDEQFFQIKKLIEENIEELNEIYHYTHYTTIYGNTPRIAELNLVQFDPEPLHCTIQVELIDGFTHLTRHITHKSSPFDYQQIIYANLVFGSSKSTAYLFPHSQFRAFMEMFPENHNTIILPDLDKVQRTTLVNQFKRYFEVTYPQQFILEEEILMNVQFQILLREAGNFILFEPRIKYGEQSFNAFEEEAFFIKEKLFKVNEEDRAFLINFLKSAHPKFDNPFQVQDYVYLELKEMINNYWFIHFNEACEAVDIEVLGQKDLSNFNYSKHRASTFMHIKSGIDWFDIEAGVSFGKEKVKTADWIRALRNGETFVRLKDGSLGVLPDEWLKQASKVLAVADVEKGQLKLSKYRFNIVEDLFENIDDKKVLQELKAKKERIKAIDTNKIYHIPNTVNATLRDYQKYGFEWLKFLDECNFGGILADDMGLGKTLQIITLLADQIDQPPSLIIVPRSLLFNWAAELDKFCPVLKYVIHHGPGRAKQMESLQENHIIITTYHTATNDLLLFKEFKFNYIVLDESQAIKNPESKRYKAVCLLQARNKLAMTGTPIENNTFDLYAQLSFTSPGLLGTKTSFKNNFSIPIDNKADQEAADLLRKLIHPFVLRRTKEQVAKDLPEKTETIIYCEMGTTQRRLYENLKFKIKQDIEEAVEEKGINKSKFQILDGLLRLRQLCNSPLLVNPSFSGANTESVKIQMLLDNLTEALDQNHHSLVFSQFVSLLTIIRNELDKRGIKYAYLDGSTRNRQREVDKFMNNDEIKVFLISIKAGNTGMNLTKADYVYIVDPWWNPAVEAQAIDRTHRIGQKNQIFAYKLICKNSIEEKILQLQAKKQKLASDLIRTDENILKSLDKEDLMALFD